MGESGNPYEFGWSDKIDYTYCVVFPKDRYSSPDAKAMELSERMINDFVNHHIVGLASTPELPITESMILIHDAINGKSFTFTNYEEFDEACGDLRDTRYLNDYGFYISEVYVRVQNAYLALVYADMDLPGKENKEGQKKELFDLLLDIRLQQACKYKETQINKKHKKEKNKRFEDVYENESDDDIARTEGYWIDEDGHWRELPGVL